MTGATIRRALATFAAAAALALASPAFAQTGQIRGVVTDAQGNPVDSAKIVFQNVDNGAGAMQTKTNKKGEYMQVGLTPGHYKITASKGDITVTKDAQIHLEMSVFDIKLVPTTPQPGSKEATAAAKAKAAAMTQAFTDGVNFTNSGQNDEAIAKFQEVAAEVPNCVACYTNIGTVQGREKKYDDAETSFKKAVDLYEAADPAFKTNPDNVNSAVNAYTGLANVYNAEKKFDLAVDAQKKATDLSGTGAAAPGGAPGAPGAAGAAPPAGNANGIYNQGVILWNAGKIPDAKAAFEQAIKLDPNLADAHYWLGMADVNGGDTAGAKTEFETYLKLAPTGDHADTAKSILASIK